MAMAAKPSSGDHQQGDDDRDRAALVLSAVASHDSLAGERDRGAEQLGDGRHRVGDGDRGRSRRSRPAVATQLRV